MDKSRKRNYKVWLRFDQYGYSAGTVFLLFGTSYAANRVEYYHTDALGSVVASTDESGNILWRESYKPYGSRIQKEVSTEDNTPFYTGKPHDDVTGLSYFGARYYDPNIGRFLGIDPVGVDPANLHSFNRYAYANNNPYRYVDPDGRWASGSGAYVHQRTTYLVIGRHLPRRENAILAKAQVYADSKSFQGTESSYRHAMRGKGQSISDARDKANAFVREQFKKAWNAESREESLFEFGVALHTLQDSTAPSHSGFQEWSGEETAGEKFTHGRKEIINPGKGSNMHKITGDAWQWYRSKKLPKGNLFKRGSD